MGKYADAGLVKYEALANPEDAARRVIQAWEEAVRSFGEQMRQNYVDNITAIATSREATDRMKERLARFYRERLIPVMPEIKPAVTPVIQSHRMRRVRVLREIGGYRR